METGWTKPKEAPADWDDAKIKWGVQENILD